MKDIIAIVGPTGVGKTKLSIELAKKLNAEIISCDSMQFYKGLDIGTAKIKEYEKQGIKHHLIDILDPKDSFSVAEYQTIVRNKIKELQDKKITPILVGGSGLYIASVLYDYRFLGKERDQEYLSNYKDYSLEDLTNKLREKAPKIANNTDLKNRRRVLRALEKTDEDLDLNSKKLFYKNAIIIALDLKRDILYERINKRVDNMIEEGLECEAEKLYSLNYESQATMAIGYKELFKHFEGLMYLEDSIELIKRNSRRYAKRQITWFKNKMECYWIKVDLNDFSKTVETAYKYIKK
ncbi:tRNA (adenosine(37)-N6)-dimethylallyltransferase MiaA [Candidatus Izemoplasma sp. B36]|uniref:tRNA (adenosine(37)-N6)-dimethylallyltransferase MiaA n=1 Tax=Candidatus Izemoplasma sp. B36 TaxID=3242468 RepID=UPI0035583521